MNEAEILNTYWPVIEKAIAVQEWYAGKTDGVQKICSDSVGDLIEALIKARLECPVQREVV